jgi:hypothetical protein
MRPWQPLIALTIAVYSLCPIADPKTGVVPANWNISVTSWSPAGPDLGDLACMDDSYIVPRALEAG